MFNVTFEIELGLGYYENVEYLLYSYRLIISTCERVRSYLFLIYQATFKRSGFPFIITASQIDVQDFFAPL